ncbi:hypothetical protein B7P43_G15247 [Cryptotermes secundus]|uniref:Reverse transcriptase domain-containing protein n=1 Tax=Cryptotermes secundus TaxID=105785 RepID=A0A2J7Q1K4_9NEOP|nr:hypothetical protein B7P43_G15247 [Cryptotermes secundus]
MKGDIKELYSIRVKLSKRKYHGIQPIENKHGALLTNDDQMRRWQDYFTEILNPAISDVIHTSYLSPTIFLVMMDSVMRTIEHKQRGIQWDLTHKLENLDFAHNFKHMTDKLVDLNREARKVGMKINQAEIKAMHVNNKNKNTFTENVDKFSYLGTIVTKEGCIVEDVRNRISKANEAFNQIQKSSDVSNELKITEQITRRKWNWISHTLRKENAVEKEALEWNPQRQRKRGVWQRTVREEALAAVKTWKEIEQLSKNHVRKQHFVVNVLCSSGR